MTTRLVAWGCVLAGLVALAGCSPAALTQRVNEIRQAALPAIAVGECTNLDQMNEESESVQTIETVDCATQHVWEAYAEKTVEGDAYPGEGVVTNLADEFCTAEFETFVGRHYDESDLYLNSLYPSESTWNEYDDRLITCLVGPPEGTVAGTLRGSER